tara:strand:+ start:414 stop:665 length:252 start_codon:yes stop_codon:yes gene_type:complete
MNTAQRYDLIETCLRLTSALHDLDNASDELIVEYTNESFPDLKLTVDEFRQYVEDEKGWAELDKRMQYELYYNNLTDFDVLLH